jgi:hypothetical protein
MWLRFLIVTTLYFLSLCSAVATRMTFKSKIIRDHGFVRKSPERAKAGCVGPYPQLAKKRMAGSGNVESLSQAALILLALQFQK